MSHTDSAVRTVRASINYARDTGRTEAFHANDHTRDTVALDPHEVEITDARTLPEPPRLEVAGFELFTLPTAVTDWRDAEQTRAVHPAEIAKFIKQLSGADEVSVNGPPILRWGERSAEAGTRDNSNAARLVHSDTSYAAAEDMAAAGNPHPDRKVTRTAHYNVWRAFSGPPIDVPLTVADFRTVSEADIIHANAIFDRDGQDLWSFVAMNFAYNPAHRWHYFSNMTPDEAIVFKRYDTDRSKPHFLPHTAFTDPNVGPEATPRASVEMRAIAYWYE